MDTTEIEKVEKVADKSQAIGEFIEWLQGPKGLTICRSITKEEVNQYREDNNERPDFSIGDLIPSRQPIEALLAEYFGIDLKKVEEEKLAILNEIREKAARR